MKILIVVDTMGTGGKERRLLELLKGLTQYEHIQCQLIILSNIVEYHDLKKLDIPIYFVPRRSRTDLTILKKIYVIVKRFQPDIIQSWSSLVSLFVFPIAASLNIIFINAMVADAPAKLKLFSSRWLRSKITFPFSDAIVANSQAGLNAYQAPTYKSHCINNGIDLNRFQHLEDLDTIRSHFGIQTKYIVGMVASFRGAKDYRTFINAAKLVVSQRKDTTFLAIGDGKDLPSIQATVTGEFKNYIYFLGRQSNVESIVNTFTVGVLMTDSRVHGEGISNSIIEYMVLQKPVIATNTGGTSELVIDGETGIITPQCDAQQLADKINKLLDNPQISENMGKAGKERVLNNFTLSHMTKRFVELYEALLLPRKSI